MELKDLFVTPLYVILIYVVAYFVRPFVTDEINRVYFFPALTIKLIGAITVGLVYQFYYKGGDTFMYHSHGSRFVWRALIEEPAAGLKLFFTNGRSQEGIYKYSSHIEFFRDSASYTVIRIATIFDLFTFSTYSATALLFAVLSFVGVWLLFLTFYKQYQHLHVGLAIAAFFIPSVFFWGSGILKDTIIMAFLGIATYHIYRIFFEHRITTIGICTLLLSIYIIFSVKKFILQAYLPAVIIWISAKNFSAIRSTMLKILLVPLLIFSTIAFSYYAAFKVGEDDDRYSLNKIAETARTTAYDIRYWSGRNAGSGYSLGELDGSFESMLLLSPQAINVSLFRPYLWEVRNPLMLLSALESFCLFCFTIYILFKKRTMAIWAFSDPNVLFTIIFSLSFAFAVGVSTFNFGTLVRYKIPLLPFFTTALLLIFNYEKSEATANALDVTE